MNIQKNWKKKHKNRSLLWITITKTKSSIWYNFYIFV